MLLVLLVVASVYGKDEKSSNCGNRLDRKDCCEAKGHMWHERNGCAVKHSAAAATHKPTATTVKPVTLQKVVTTVKPNAQHLVGTSATPATVTTRRTTRSNTSTAKSSKTG